MTAPVTPSEAQAKFRKRYNNQLPNLLLSDQHSFGFPLYPPTGTDAIANQQQVAAWITSWQAVSFCEVTWKDINWRRAGLGTQRLPMRAEVTTSCELAKAAGQVAHFNQIRERFNRLCCLTNAGICSATTIAQAVRSWQDLSDTDEQTLINATLWLATHPDSGLTPRAIPVTGMHSKWLENHKRLLHRLLGSTKLGLQLTDFTVRVLLLDPMLRHHQSLRDLEVPFAQLPAVCLPPSMVIMVENKESFLILPDFPIGSKVIGIWGKGYEASTIATSPLIHTAQIQYFGDLDADGFTILDRVRSNHPQVSSVLMDLTAIKEYRHLAVPDPNQQSRVLYHLTDSEQQAYHQLLAENLRIEQERINAAEVIAALQPKATTP